MKKIITKSACSLFMFLFVSGQLFAQTDAELKSKIEKMNKDMASAMMASNTEKIMSYYTDDVISLPNNDKMLKGKDALKKSNEEMMKSGSKINSFETNTMEVKSSGNTVIEIGTYKMSFLMAGATEPIEDMGKYVTVWEKQKDGSLKIKYEIWNTDINHMEKMEKEKAEKKM